MKLTRISGLVAVAMLTASSIAYASGLYESFPIVGGASHCEGSTGTSSSTCATTVPAGPTATTGSETIPADTGLSSGRTPQTVVMSMRALNAAPVSYNLCAAAACGSFTIGNNSGGILLSYSTTIDSATITTPASPMDGQRFVIAADHTITSLTVAANTGSSLAVTTPTVLTASTTVGQGYAFMYVASTTKWYRVY